MVTISTPDAFLFFGAAALGLSVGVIGSFFINSLFRVFDDGIENWSISNKKRFNLIIFIIGTTMLTVLLSYLVIHFEIIRHLP